MLEHATPQHSKKYLQWLTTAAFGMSSVLIGPPPAKAIRIEQIHPDDATRTTLANTSYLPIVRKDAPEQPPYYPPGSPIYGVANNIGTEVQHNRFPKVKMCYTWGPGFPENPTDCTIPMLYNFTQLDWFTNSLEAYEQNTGRPYDGYLLVGNECTQWNHCNLTTPKIAQLIMKAKDLAPNAIIIGPNSSIEGAEKETPAVIREIGKIISADPNLNSNYYDNIRKYTNFIYGIHMYDGIERIVTGFDINGAPIFESQPNPWVITNVLENTFANIRAALLEVYSDSIDTLPDMKLAFTEIGCVTIPTTQKPCQLPTHLRKLIELNTKADKPYEVMIVMPYATRVGYDPFAPTTDSTGTSFTEYGEILNAFIKGQDTSPIPGKFFVDSNGKISNYPLVQNQNDIQFTYERRRISSRIANPPTNSEVWKNKFQHRQDKRRIRMGKNTRDKRIS